MTVNKATLDLIKEFEGYRSNAYLDPIGIWTIGYGTTGMAGVGIVPRPGMTITEADATEYLHRALDKFAASIRPKITAPINENEFGAFMSLAYNIGPGAFGKSSALRKFNAGDKAGAADAILLWNKAGGKILAGLVRRRKAERALFLAPLASKPVDVSKTPKIEHQTSDVSKKPPISDITQPAMSGASPPTQSNLQKTQIATNPLARLIAAMMAWLGKK